MKCVFRCATLTEAYLVCGILKSEGISVVLRNEHLAGLAGEIPFLEAWPEVWVTDGNQVKRAETIIAEYQRDRPFLVDG